MPEQILVTAGAGFIGLHLVDGLLRAGHGVRVLDSLVEQVRGDSQRPEYLARDAELIAGDVRNAEVVRGALEDTDSVVHLAARVGVGQSMYEPAEYAAANTAGTGVLLEALLDHPVRKLVVASSIASTARAPTSRPRLRNGHASSSSVASGSRGARTASDSSRWRRPRPSSRHSPRCTR